MDDFSPELGQFGFSNTPWQDYSMPGWMESGLDMIALAIAAKRGDGADWLLTTNAGGEPHEGDVFAMRAYCWCDGLAHPEGCPPNFQCFPADLTITWYKHAGRSASMNRPVTPEEWVSIVRGCLASMRG